MEIKQLTYFIVLAEEGNYLRAANRLGISQPALSIAVKKLEEELGIQLFFSFGRRKELTDAGICLLENARNLVSMYQQTIDDVSHVNQKMHGVIRFGLPPLMGSCFFGQIIPSFSEKYPNVKIDIVEQGAVTIDRMIHNGELDIALSLPTNRTAAFEVHPFTTQQIMVILSKDHPLANRKSLKIADLRDEKFVIFNENFILHERTMAACHSAGFFPKITLLTSQWDFMIDVVAKTQSISLLPKQIYEMSANPNITAVPLADGLKYWDVIVIRNKTRYFSKVCEAFYKHMITNAPPSNILV